MRASTVILLSTKYQPDKKEANVKDKNISRRISLEPRDYKLVIAFAKRAGLGSHNFSAALRMIIREWDRLTRSSPNYNPIKSLFDRLNDSKYEDGQ
jgi:hypothetical protein